MSIKSALIFHTGKILFTGVTNREAMEVAFDELTRKLKAFKKQAPKIR
jgi:TATA-box binding protein (TBP) (component of TFIID and TFIIIB)